MFNTDDLFLVHKRIGDLLDLLDSAPNNPLAFSTAVDVCVDCSGCLSMLVDYYSERRSHIINARAREEIEKHKHLSVVRST